MDNGLREVIQQVQGHTVNQDLNQLLSTSYALRYVFSISYGRDIVKCIKECINSYKMVLALKEFLRRSLGEGLK